MVVTAKELKEQTHSLNILYVEDEESLRESMQKSLEKLFNNVHIAQNGQEAFEVYKKENIDIVLTDINMPIMSGSELIYRVQEHEGADPIILVLSAYNESRLLVGLINNGIDGFLNKPVEKQLLINLLYKSCKNINNAKLLMAYQEDLQRSHDNLARRNKILNQKQNQLSAITNKSQKAQSSENAVNDYSTFSLEDKEELADLSLELESYILRIFQFEQIHEDFIDKLEDAYRKYARVLNRYSEFNELARMLNHLGETLLSQNDNFKEDIQQSAIYLESLHLSLENFRENIWNKESKDKQFYNASLLNDINVVCDFFNAQEAKENTIDFF